VLRKATATKIRRTGLPVARLPLGGAVAGSGEPNEPKGGNAGSTSSTAGTSGSSQQGGAAAAGIGGQTAGSPGVGTVQTPWSITAERFAVEVEHPWIEGNGMCPVVATGRIVPIDFFLDSAGIYAGSSPDGPLPGQTMYYDFLATCDGAHKWNFPLGSSGLWFDSGFVYRASDNNVQTSLHELLFKSLMSTAPFGKITTRQVRLSRFLTLTTTPMSGLLATSSMLSRHRLGNFQAVPQTKPLGHTLSATTTRMGTVIEFGKIRQIMVLTTTPLIMQGMSIC